ncbi:MAG: site-2 protease family protein [Chloroflexi bacterium]|nr:MAG: site-2 protease family protein [Chloroflexota bacterium]
MTVPSTTDSSSQGRTDSVVQLVSQILDIEGYTLGDTKADFMLRFSGQLKLSSEEAYEILLKQLRPLRLNPLFRAENGNHLIYIKETLPKPEEPSRRINYILFLVTFISVLFAGIQTVYEGPNTLNPAEIWMHVKDKLDLALAFALSMLAILTAHEFGHYFAARFHKTRVTLPFFIPFPLSPFGTMGAFIRLLEPPKNKKVLLDIGLAGPLAGLVVTIPVLIVGLTLSSVNPLPEVFPADFGFEGNSILYLILKYLIHGAWLPQPTTYQNLSPLVYWIRYFFTGYPLPLGGLDVTIHPVAWAGWAGLLVTSLNLLPAGQLDGGHLVYSLYGNRLKWIRPLIVVVLFVLGFLWSGWWLWAFMILLLGGQYAEPLDDITELDRGRKALAHLGLIIFFLIFMPVPLIII